MPRCTMCYYRTNAPADLVQHTSRVHRFNPNFRVQCQFAGCGETFDNWLSFKSHLRRVHRNNVPPQVLVPFDEVLLPGQNEIANDAPPPDGDNVVGAGLADNPIPEQEENVNNAPPPNGDAEGAGPAVNPFPDQGNGPQVPPVKQHMDQAAQFLLTLKTDGNITQRALSMVIAGADDIMHSYLNNVQAELLEKIQNPGGNIGVDDVSEVFRKAKEASMFEGVHSQHLLDKYVTDHGGLTPEKVFLGETRFWSKSEPPVVMKQKQYMHVVSLKESLQLLLNNREILGYVENPREVLNDGVYRDIRDGSRFKNHPVFSADSRALIIYFYPDEIQTTNALGSKIHKFMMMYWSLGNIPAHLRSSLRAINLYGIVRSKFVKKFGPVKVLSRFLQEICELESADGLSLIINGQSRRFRGSLLFVTGDTPAQQYFAGAKESVANAHLPCRGCLGDKEFMQNHFVESDFVLRDKESHEEHVRLVTDNTVPKAVQTERSRQYGVVGESAFCVIDSFDVTKCFVQDLMHVMYEGIFPMEVQLFLKYVIDQGLITLAKLNDAISSFDFVHLTRDTPSSIEPPHLDNKLRQNSMQMSALAHVLPFVMKPVIEADPDAVDRLLNIVKLLQIVNVCLSFEITEDDIVMVEHLIRSHHHCFKAFYPDVALPPKFHYLVHFPRQMMEFGPMRETWCIRFEAAHFWFKRLMHITLSYKNPVFSMVRSYCKRRSNLFIGGQNEKFLDLGDKIMRGKGVMVREHPERDLVRLSFMNARDEDFVLNVRGVVVRGTTYTCKSIILLRSDPEELPVFGKVIQITVFNQEISLIYELLQTLYFDNVLNAYCIERNNGMHGAINVNNLIFQHPLSAWVCQEKRFVVLFNRKSE